jgi:hypothetical protein
VLKGPRLAALPLLGFISFVFAPSAHAWGCKGHQAVALIAEAHLTPHAREMALNILDAVPIDPTLPRYCGASGLDPFADASTWPDDIRRLRPDTPAWHFIDIPRGAPKSDIAKYCPEPEGCVTSALTEQVRVLRDPGSTAQAKADALRFIIHFVGDIHQPLHAITNNDMGGNCVPVTFFGQAPQEGPPGRRSVEPGGSVQSSPGNGSFHPNLHSVWDTDIVEHLSPGQTFSQLANTLDKQFAAKFSDWVKQPTDFEAWAWESHELAEKVTYGKLPHPLPIETPRLVSACVDPTDPTSHDRLLKIDENLGDDYQNAAAPVVEEQLAKAGARLAALLNSIWR